MPNHPPTLAVLRSTFRQSGRLDWIGTRPAWRAAMGSRSRVKLTADSGITGDRYSDGGRRQVTLIQAVHLPVIAALCGRDSIDPVLLRRNPVISDIDLQAWRDHRFFIGTALPEGSGCVIPARACKKC